MKSELLTA